MVRNNEESDDIGESDQESHDIALVRAMRRAMASRRRPPETTFNCLHFRFDHSTARKEVATGERREAGDISGRGSSRGSGNFREARGWG